MSENRPGADVRPPRKLDRVGIWLGLLLLFVPVFYPLLYLRPYSWPARLGWGAWLGLVVFVKVAGLSEPVINLSQIEQELGRREQSEAATAPDAAPGPSAEATFVQPDADARPDPPLADYLRELGGGVLGRRIADYSVDGATIMLRFRSTDWYLDSEDAVTLESIGAALSLFYGRDFEQVRLELELEERPLSVELSRSAFEAFFNMSGSEIRASLSDRASQEASPFRAENIPPEQRRAFFQQFATYRQ